MKINLTSTALAVIVIGTLAMATAARAQGRSEQALAALATAQHLPNEVLVQYRPGVSAQQKADALGRVGAVLEENVVNGPWRRDGKGDLDLAKLPPGIGIAAAVRRLEADPAIEFAEPNWIYYHNATSNDPYFTNGSLWGMYGSTTSPANQYGSQAAAAWAAGKTGGGTVYVGIIDEGIQHSHADLKANMWENPFDPVDGIDNDGNGLVDDVRGWDFDGKNNTTYDGTQDDHGTHVAGTIGATGGNGIGVAGVCWNVKIITLKFLGRRGGSLANAIKAVDYLTDLKTRHGLNIVASNNSWGGGGYSAALFDAIGRANAANILFVAAAGNGGSDGVGDNNDTTASYPSNYTQSNVIAVAAITSTGGLASWSNYGATTVDLGAPGSGIYSTLPGDKYGSYSGTSMATPHVTGACALYASLIPGATAAQIKAAILNSTTSTPSLIGKTATGGRLNVSGF